MPDGGELLVAAGPSGDGRYALVIGDTGVGIPAGGRQRGFVAYFHNKTSGAGSGQEALDALEHENVDLVLTDLVMPGMTGEDLIDAILAKTPGTPIILNSAYGTIQTAGEAIKRGAFYYFEH